MARREPRWVRVFLKALAETGNVRVAAERAGVDFSTAYQRRKRHPGFAEAWEAAIRMRGQQVAPDCAVQNMPPPSASPTPPPVRLGEGLVARPDGKVVRESPARWGKRAESAFLMELTAGANVRMAARAAGFSTQAAYKKRLKDRRFAAAWDAAIESGRARVQAYLIEAATRTFDPDDLPVADDGKGPTVSVGEAINIAKLSGAGGRGGASQAAASGDDPEFDGTPITREEWEQARDNLWNRLERLRERLEAGPKCEGCGQPMPYLQGTRGHPPVGC